MQKRKSSRGSQPAIPPSLWPELQQLERAGQTLREIQDWLLSNHQIAVSDPTVSRTLARIRAASPIVQPPGPVLAPATDEDELANMRRHVRAQIYSAGLPARDQREAIKLVIAIMAEQREQRQAKSPAPQPVLPAPGPAAQPATALTPEEEARAVRAQLGKLGKLN